MNLVILALFTSLQLQASQYLCGDPSNPPEVAMEVEIKTLSKAKDELRFSVLRSNSDSIGFLLPVASDLEVGFGGEIWNEFELAPNPSGCPEDPNPYLARLRMYKDASKTKMVATGIKKKGAWKFTFGNLSLFYLEVKATVPMKNAPDLSKNLTLLCTLEPATLAR
jgi:hypothetical protein